MTLNKSILVFNETGPCSIDIDKAIKYFDKKSFISRWHDEYRLVRITNKRCVKLKVTISANDAIKLISELALEETVSPTFKNAATYRIGI